MYCTGARVVVQLDPSHFVTGRCYISFSCKGMEMKGGCSEGFESAIWLCPSASLSLKPAAFPYTHFKRRASSATHPAIHPVHTLPSNQKQQLSIKHPRLFIAELSSFFWRLPNAIPDFLNLLHPCLYF
ncbi:hypothetical protein PGT21_020856 [Puccinia graminis f. sp. tritici]|uniref:Uncharacterized protein n=1 Tax=Puccinia graminis f. sp. tritici TaxID=56615 RepID=A0A5B0MF96_PUCGR|nr:hypothetical protein PGT21_020856 [Puccinia graminis f. sp. tritici]